MDEVIFPTENRAAAFAVFSDFHGNLALLKRAVEQSPPFDAVIHLGDVWSDGEYLRGITSKPVFQVAGNNDYARADCDELMLSVDGIKIYCVHGHKYGVYFGVDRLVYRGRELNANIVLFGHTHQSFEAYEDGMLLINPGAAGRWVSNGSSYALLTVDKGCMTNKFYRI